MNVRTVFDFIFFCSLSLKLLKLHFTAENIIDLSYVMFTSLLSCLKKHEEEKSVILHCKNVFWTCPRLKIFIIVVLRRNDFSFERRYSSRNDCRELLSCSLPMGIMIRTKVSRSLFFIGSKWKVCWFLVVTIFLRNINDFFSCLKSLSNPSEFSSVILSGREIIETIYFKNW